MIVTKVVKDIKAQGPDEIRPRLLTECQSSFVKLLTPIYKKSLDYGILPEQWKQANVTPVFKSGKKDKVENYRPISVTSLIYRVMETVIRNAIINYLDLIISYPITSMAPGKENHV